MPPRRPSVARALASALKARPLQPWEEATGAVARRLALELDGADEPKVAGDLAAKLLPVLAALGMTRQAASTVAKGGDGGVPVGRSALDEIRARRRAN